MPPSLKSRTIHLHTPCLHLRPMTNADWQDLDVLYYADSADVTAYTLGQIKHMYRRHLAIRLLLLSPNSTASPSPRLG